VELVARTEEVRRDEVGEALPVLGGVDLGVDEVRLLGDAVRRVGLLRVAVPERVLGERHRGELGYEHTVPTRTVLSTSWCRAASITYVPMRRLAVYSVAGSAWL
jgi:hypothetical protein